MPLIPSFTSIKGHGLDLGPELGLDLGVNPNGATFFRFLFLCGHDDVIVIRVLSQPPSWQSNSSSTIYS